MALTIAGGDFYPWVNRELDIGASSLNRDNASRLSKRWSNKSLATTMTQHSVEVLSQRYALYVYQYADNLWIAEGDFLANNSER